MFCIHGQTNIVDSSFVKNREHNLDKLSSDDMYLKDTTSLRMSEIGYQSKAQKNLDIKYNSLDDFLKKIKGYNDPLSEFSNKGLKILKETINKFQTESFKLKMNIMIPFDLNALLIIIIDRMIYSTILASSIWR